MLEKILLITLITATVALSACATDLKTEGSSTKEQPQSVKEESKPTVEVKKIGEDIVMQNFTVKVNSFRETTILSAKYSTPKQARQGAKFVIIDINVTNTTTTPFTISLDDNLRLIDKQEREFKIYNNLIGSIDNYFSYRELAPSLYENGVIVYEIPTDAEQYILTVFEQNMSKAYVVKLKEEKKPEVTESTQK